MDIPPFPEARIGGEIAEDAKHGEMNRGAQCSIGTIAPRIDEVVVAR